jgi:hypothetical protein
MVSSASPAFSRNQLLSALSADDLALLMPKLERVPLEMSHSTAKARTPSACSSWGRLDLQQGRPNSSDTARGCCLIGVSLGPPPRLRPRRHVTRFSAMRLLRTLAHLVLALALIGAGAAPARAIAVVRAPMSHSHMDHAPGVAVEHAADHHGAPQSEHPAHKQDACQTLCCFIPSQMPRHGPAGSAVEFFCPVRYMDAAQPGAGRTYAPDPGIPKPVV